MGREFDLAVTVGRRIASAAWMADLATAARGLRCQMGPVVTSETAAAHISKHRIHWPHVLCRFAAVTVVTFQRGRGSADNGADTDR